MLRWRLLSAGVILCLVLTLVGFDFTQLAGAPPGTWLLPLMIVIGVMGAEEVLSLYAAKDWRPVAWPVYVGTVAVLFAFAQPVWNSWLLAMGASSASWRTYANAVPSLPMTVFALSVGAIVVAEMRRFAQPGSHVVHIALATFAVVYVGILGGYMVALRLLGDNVTGMNALVSMCVVTKLTDTGAYTFGRMFGSRKLTPRLSPGKTLEGAIGGLATAILASWIYFRFLAPALMPVERTDVLPYGNIAAYGLLLGIAGMIGDLAESLLKRDMQRKDSSTWLPGLGGILDIIDSLLFAGPVAYLCWQLGLVY